MKQYKLVLVALLGLIVTACYNKFEMPEPTVIYNDETFEAANPDLKYITIAQLKAKYGKISGYGTNESLETTRYLRFVESADECTEFEQQKKWYDTGDYYIKGKVISNDEQGNAYKSLYIFDGTAAIELKLTNGLHLDYPCNFETGETMWVYVKLRGLYLGNFRMMLSLGDVPTSSNNAYGRYKFYANSNIVSPTKFKLHVFPGEKDVLTRSDDPQFTTAAERKAADIYVVNESNYNDIHGNNTEAFLGRLIYFKNVKVRYSNAAYMDSNGNTVMPTSNIKNGSYDQYYPSWLCTSGLQESLPTTPGGAYTYVVNQPWYKVAYSVNNVALYGSFCVTYSDAAGYTSSPGVYVVRTSGYAKFSNRFVPNHGSVGNVLAIYQIYSEDSTYKGGSGDKATYQLVVNNFEHMEFNMEPKEDLNGWKEHLAQAEVSFPNYTYPVTDYDLRNALLEIWKGEYEANKPVDDGSELWDEWNAWGNWVIWALENTPELSYVLPQQIVEDTDTIE